METPFLLPPRRPLVPDRTILSSLCIDVPSVIAMHTLLLRPHETAFRLECRSHPSDTVLHMTIDTAGQEGGDDLSVAPSKPGKRPCIFAHTHTCLPDRELSPPSLNDIVSLINDCCLRIPAYPLALVVACERAGPRVYVYDCTTAPQTPPVPLPPEDMILLSQCCAKARQSARNKQSQHAPVVHALETLLGHLRSQHGERFDLLAAVQHGGALARPAAAAKRWVEYVVGAALAIDSSCCLGVPEWMEEYLPAGVGRSRSECSDLQLAQRRAWHQSAEHLRAWHVCCRDAPLPQQSESMHISLIPPSN
jgi:hypothetical protein